MTSKELAKLLGISETAVSFALNDKPGVSQKTRQMVKKAALENGMNTKEKHHKKKSGNVICALYYQPLQTEEASDFFRSTFNGVEMEAADHGYRVEKINVTSSEELRQFMHSSPEKTYAGAVVFGYLMGQMELNILAFCNIPMVVLDNHCYSEKMDFVVIDNVNAAFQATNFLINKRQVQPGYLRSSIRTFDFRERETGFFNAIRYNMMQKNLTITHDLSPASIEAAEADMDDILAAKEITAPSYFADNDMIAIGAMRSFKKHGYRVPEDISIVGFDDISVSGYVEPALTTVHIPRYYMGRIAVQRLLKVAESDEEYRVNIQINGYLKVRHSIAPVPQKTEPDQDRRPVIGPS